MTVFTPTPAKANVTVQEIVSPGGIRAWFVHEPSIPVVAIEFAFRGGAAQDPAGKPGVASMLSSLLDEGAGDMDAQAFQNLAEDNAVELSFSADRDTLTGSLRTLTARQDVAFDLLSQAITSPRLDADAIERIRAQTMARLRRDSIEPNSVASRAFWAAAFPGHPYGQPVSGSEESVAAITREDLAAFHGRTFARDNLVIAAVGAIEPEALGRALDTIFGALPETADLAPVPEVAIASVGETVVAPLEIPQSTLIFAREGLKRDDPDFIPAFVLNHILGGGTFSSRLFREVREARGLVYSVSSSLYPLSNAGLLIGSLATGNARAGEALDVVKAQMTGLIEKGATNEELTLAKQFLTGSYPLQFDSSLRIARNLRQLQLDGLTPAYITQRNALVEAVTLDDLQRVARRILGEGDLLVVAAGQPENLEPTTGVR